MYLNFILFFFSGTVAIKYGLVLWQIHHEGVEISFKMNYQYKLHGTYFQKHRKYQAGLTTLWAIVIACSLVAATSAALIIADM